MDAFEAVGAYRDYVGRELAAGTHLAAMTRHMLGLFHGQPGARTWRRILTVEGVRPGAGLEVIDQALAAISGLQDERVRRGLEAGQPAQVAHAKQRGVEALLDDQGADVVQSRAGHGH